MVPRTDASSTRYALLNVGEEYLVLEPTGDGAPFTVDLQSQLITGPAGPDFAFDIPSADRMRLLEGLDDIGLTLKHADEIVDWERRIATDQPWLQNTADSRT